MMRTPGCLLFLAIFPALTALSVDVRTFGAVGDGLSDDTLAIQRAADSVSMNGSAGHERMWMVSRYGAKAMSGSSCREVFFPPGRYRLSGPVVFDYNVTLRGDGAVIILPVSGDGFFFQQALRVDIEGLRFVGGKVQVRHWSANRDTATCLVRGCQFEGASQTAFASDAYRENTKKVYSSRGAEMASGVLRKTCSSVIARCHEGVWSLENRDPESYVEMENSTNFIFDECTFSDNVQALDVRSDGCVIRNCRFSASDLGAMPMVTLGVRAHVYGCSFLQPIGLGRSPVRCRSGNVTVERCSFSGVEDGLAAVEWVDPPSSGYIASSLIFKNVSMACTNGVAVRFEPNAFPNTLSIDGLKGGGVAVSFAEMPTRERLENALKGCRHPDLGPELSYGISMSRLDGFRDDLPAVLERFRRTVPTIVRQDVDWPDSCFAHAAETRFFDGDYVTVTNTFVCRDGMLIGARGRCVLKASSDSFPLFRVPSGACVKFENLTFYRGKHAVLVEGDGCVETVNCAFYEQAGETFLSPGGRIRTFGGIAYTPYLYRGAGVAFFDALWYSCVPDHGRSDYRACEYAAIRVERGGRLYMRDLLGVPCYFRHIQPMITMWKEKPTEDQVGDFRWIDSQGEIWLQECRFGGEWGGLTPVYQRGDRARTYIEGPYFATDCRRLRTSFAVNRIDSEAKPILIDEVTTSFGLPYADSAYNSYPHRHDNFSGNAAAEGSKRP